MRRNAGIEAVWNSGMAIGLGRATARVTVNRTWTLQEIEQFTPYTRNGMRNPMRSYNNGTDVTIPIQCIKSISWDRSLQSDTASMTLTLLNAHPTDGPSVYKQGLFSQRRTLGGTAPVETPSSFPRLTGDRDDVSGDVYWGDSQGADGEDIAFSYGAIAQGNMLKTYEGYGPYQECTGVWIIDTVTVTSKGDLSVSARDVGALLVDQTMYARGPMATGWSGGIVANFSYPTAFFSAQYNSDYYGDPKGSPPHSTNYSDITEIVQLICGWAGFADGGGLLGGYEQTGIASTSMLKPEMFDKKPPIDPIKALRDMVGYTTFVDQDGGFRFNRGNQWKSGNDIDGVHTSAVFDISERNQLIEYAMTGSKSVDRSAVIATEADPYLAGLLGAPTPRNAVRRVNNNQLHAMRIPAIIPMDHRTSLKEIVTTAELTNLRAWFQRRHGTVTIMGTPLIDIDDQVRITERTTYDFYLHHVAQISSQHDVQTGVWTQTLSTHWMGPAQNFDIRVDEDGHVIYNGAANGIEPNDVAVNGYQMPYEYSGPMP